MSTQGTTDGPGTPVPRTYPQGVPCWVDLEVDDVGAAADFYAGLLGWELADAVPPGVPGSYLVATVGGLDVAAIGTPDPDAPPLPPAWSTYVAVDDADAAADAVRAAGGRVLHGPTDVGPGGAAGRAVLCRDPQGLDLRLWQAGRRLGAQHVNVPGGWGFSHLRAGDDDAVAAALAFYVPLLGWRVRELWPGSPPWITLPGYGDHLAATSEPRIHEEQSFAPEGFADVVAAVQPVPPGDRPRWEVSFGVADRDAAAARVEELGGEVLRAADDGWTRSVEVRDPVGADVTLTQFTPPDGA
ncbi:VOC family protein [Pseudokineococcus lusitanus]|uniref:VOC domain-containing protein n=1 Tax=Pseudokineococcus lusitanus TaxID=763993 RepID=A0A3N1HMN2_9ACTN|nr:VOC family protein [Pseudokineococcus lusitanus]ROP43793.1 hypothetical protein EDC03_1389 [Pseudokineococcus lusitanus]